MKKHFPFFAGLIMAGSLASCTATYVVRERPSEIVYSRPRPPYEGAVWITGDWIWLGGRYEWREGHWDRRREGYQWVEGHWQATRGGWRWRPGHWQRF